MKELENKTYNQELDFDEFVKELTRLNKQFFEYKTKFNKYLKSKYTIQNRYKLFCHFEDLGCISTNKFSLSENLRIYENSHYLDQINIHDYQIIKFSPQMLCKYFYYDKEIPDEFDTSIEFENETNFFIKGPKPKKPIQ